MMALSGVPLFFSGFWSKDEILHSAMNWQPSRWPFYFGIAGAFLTAFYMTRQVWYVFFGAYRGGQHKDAHSAAPTSHGGDQPHESPPVMTVPLVILAVCAVLLSVIATPIWPWFHSYLMGHSAHVESISDDVLKTMLLSTCIVAAGIGLAWRLYASQPAGNVMRAEPLESI